MVWSREPHRYRGVAQPQAERIRSRDRWTCQKCGEPGYEVDHIENVAAGGSDADTNLWVLCQPCHQIKTADEAAAGRAQRSRKRAVKPHPGLRQNGQFLQTKCCTQRFLAGFLTAFLATGTSRFDLA
uniref:HNH endonuclease n=1 Tax=Nocardia suismassiliense TaxID=2077092 RepID=UPI003F49949F